MRVLSENEVRQHLDASSLISALEIAFRDRYLDFSIPTRVQMKLANGILLIMPCYDRIGRALGMKLVSVRNEEACPGDRIQATVMLMDPATAQPRLMMAANYLTDLRTAATSALATKLLARQDVRTLGIFGTGRQARAHLKVLLLVRKFDRALVCARDRERLRAFCDRMSRETNLPVEPADAERCAAESDVVCTCTDSKSPLFDGKLLHPGTHLNLIGAFQPHTREVDSVVIRDATVVVETYGGAFAEAGDILIPMQEGVIDRDHLKMDLRELINIKNFRRTSTEITVFKSVGCALEDLVAAELVEKSFTTG